MKRVSRPIAWALTITLAVMLSARCITPAAMTTAQMACCATMGSECGHRAEDQSCCSKSQRVDQLTATKRVTIPPPGAVIGPLALLPEISKHSLVDHGHHHVDGFTLKPPGIPRYLLLSVLLI